MQQNNVDKSLTNQSKNRIVKKQIVQSGDEKSAGLQNAIFSDANPPASFTTPVNNRRWIFSETIEMNVKEGTWLDLLQRVKRKYHTLLPYFKQFNKRRTVRRVTLACRTVALSAKCPFAVLIQKTDRKGRFHIYESEKHTCMHKDGVLNGLPKNELLSDAHPPASIATLGDQQWSFLETIEMRKSSVNEMLRTIRRKYNCFYTSMKLLTKGRSISRLQLYCTMRTTAKGKCPFKLLAQKTDRGRYHLYASGQHNCFHKNEVKSAKNLPEKVPLSDAHPPASIVTLRGRHWTFKKTMEVVEKDVDSQLEKWAKNFHCRDANKPRRNAAKQQHQSVSICRVQLLCTACGQLKRCHFAVLLHKTDKGRFHLYWSGKRHTCLHAGKGEGGSWKEEEEEMDEIEEIDDEDNDELEEKEDKESDEDEEEGGEELEKNYDDDEESEEDEVEEELEYNEEEEDREVVEEEDPIDHNEDEMEEEENYKIKDEEEGDEVGTEDHMEREDVMDEDDDENDEEGNRAFDMANDDEEDDGVQFIDFVDHPKSEGVKMRRLDEPKKEPGANAAMITMDEEEPTNRRRKINVPKREVVKEEEPEEQQPGPSNKGKQQQTAIGIAVLPIAAINQQNKQQPVVLARERWWAKEDRLEAAPNNEKRLLRERKRRINYQE